MIDLIGILLDRYGIIAPNTVSDAGVAGGFSAIYPVLKRMEEKGTLLRGVFVKKGFSVPLNSPSGRRWSCRVTISIPSLS